MSLLHSQEIATKKQEMAEREEGHLEEPVPSSQQEGFFNGIVHNIVLVVGFVVFAYAVTHILKVLD